MSQRTVRKSLPGDQDVGGRVTLRARLTAAFVAVVLIPLVLGAALLAGALPGAFGDQQGRALASSARLASALVGGLCDRARATAEAAGRGVLSIPADATGEQLLVLQSLVDRGLADALRVTDAAGRVSEVGQVPVGAADCSAGTATGGVIAAVVRLEQPGQDGVAEAVAVAGADDVFARTLQQSTGGQVAVLAGDQVVASTAPPSGSLMRRALAAAGEPVRNDSTVAVFTPGRPGAPLGVLLTQPVEGGLQIVGTAVAVVFGAVLLAAGLALLLARATTRPLEELGQAAARVTSGDLSTTIEVRSHDEVGRLAAAFNTMTDELRGHVGALEASRDELRAGLARLGETLTSTHDLDRILAVVLETALASTTARSGAVLLRADDGAPLVLAASRGLPDLGAGTDQRVPLGEGIVGQVAMDGRHRRGAVSDVDPLPLDPDANSVVAVALRTGEEIHGVLVLYDPRSDGAGHDEDLTTLRTLADQAAVAVENVMRHRDVSLMAVTDGLTGLANFRSFTETIARELERATRFGRQVGLVLLDIDHFKDVNDTFGHQRGDAVLIELARRVKAQVRDVDTVARYGGEELVVVLPETDERGAELAAERIRHAVSDEPFGELAEGPVRVTVSLGVAVHPGHATTPAGLLRRADEALYAAKRAGRDTWRMAVAEHPATEVHDDPASAPH